MASLKTELGLGEPKPAGSTEQADKFKAAFQAAIAQVNQSLQYTAAHAEQVKHDPHATKRDTTCSAYQVALGRIDPTNPAVAQGAIDQVIAGVNSVKSAAESLKTAVEKAFNTWTSRQSELDGVSDKIREMIDWGHAKASALGQVAEAVAAKANQRAWEAATKALDQVLDKVKPIYEEFLRQKAAKEEYDPALAALQPRLEKVHASTYKKLDAQKQAICAAEEAMKQAASSMDFVTALAQLKSLEGLVCKFETDFAEIEAKKQQYEQARAEIDGKASQASTSEYKVLVELDQQIVDLTGRTDQAAADEDYDQAITLVGELGCKVDEKLAKVAELDAKRTEYEQKRAEVDGRAAEVATCEYKVLAELDEQIVELQGRVDQAAADQDYDQALQLLGELTCKVDEKVARVAELDAKRTEYEQKRAEVDGQLAEVSTCEFKTLAELDQQIVELQGRVDQAATEQEYDQALQLLDELKCKIEEKKTRYTELLAKRTEYEAASAAALDKMGGCMVTARDYKDLKADRDALPPKRQEMETAAGAEDYDKAIAAAKDLDGKATKYLADCATEQKKYDDKAAEVTKALDDANYFTRDDAARELAGKLSDEDLKYMPTEVRNRMMKELQEGYFSDDDKKAIERIYKVRTLDPEFEKEEMKHREELVNRMKSDPEFKEARAKWGTMSKNEKLKVMEKAVNMHADVYGTKDRDPPIVIDPVNEPPEIDGTTKSWTNGTYNHGSGKLEINTNSDPDIDFNNFDRSLDLAVHETNHRYQAVLREKVESGDIKPGDPLYNQAVAFQLNDNYYVNDPQDVYENQPEEAHSRISALTIQNAGIGR